LTWQEASAKGANDRTVPDKQAFLKIQGRPLDKECREGAALAERFAKWSRAVEYMVDHRAGNKPCVRGTPPTFKLQTLDKTITKTKAPAGATQHAAVIFWFGFAQLIRAHAATHEQREHEQTEQSKQEQEQERNNIAKHMANHAGRVKAYLGEDEVTLTTLWERRLGDEAWIETMSVDMARTWAQEATDIAEQAGKRSEATARKSVADWVNNSLVGGAKLAHRWCNVAGQLPPPKQEWETERGIDTEPLQVMQHRVRHWEKK